MTGEKRTGSILGSFPLSRNHSLYVFLLPSAAFIVIFVAYPILFNIWLSFHDVGLRTLVGDRPFAGLGNYIRLFTSPLFGEVLLNSVAFTLGSIIPQFIIGFALALFLMKQFPGSSIVRGGIILGWVIAPIVVGTVWRWIFNTDYGLLNHLLRQFGLIDSPLSWLPNPQLAMISVIIANVWLGIPFNLMLLMGGLSALSETLYEAASIDGTNRLQRLVYITIPLMKQTIAATLMLGLMFTFKVFDLIWVMTGGGPVDKTTTMPILAYRYSFTFFNFGMGTAVASSLFVLMAVLSIFYILGFVGRDE